MRHPGLAHIALFAGGDLAGDPVRANSRVGFIDDRDVDLDIGAENMSIPTVFGQSLHHSERIGRNRGAVPLYDIAVVVVMRRFYQI